MPIHDSDVAASEHVWQYDAPPLACAGHQRLVDDERPSAVVIGDANDSQEAASPSPATEEPQQAAPPTIVTDADAGTSDGAAAAAFDVPPDPRRLNNRHRVCGAVVSHGAAAGASFIEFHQRDPESVKDVFAVRLDRNYWRTPVWLLSTASVRTCGIARVLRSLAMHISKDHRVFAENAMDPQRVASLAKAKKLVVDRLTQSVKHVSHLLKIPGVGGVMDLSLCIGFVPLNIVADAGDRKRRGKGHLEDREFVVDRVFFGKNDATSKPSHYVYLGQVPRSFSAAQLFWVFVALTEMVPYSVVIVNGSGGEERLPDGSTKEKNKIGGAKVYCKSPKDAQRAVDFTHCAFLGDFGAFIGAEGAKEQFVNWHEARKAYLAEVGAPFTAIGPLVIEAGSRS